eukprot:gene10763-biopygen5128
MSSRIGYDIGHDSGDCAPDELDAPPREQLAAPLLAEHRRAEGEERDPSACLGTIPTSISSELSGEASVSHDRDSE